MAGLESALSHTELDTQSTLKAANAVVNKLKKIRSFAKQGCLRELKKSIEEAEVAIGALKQHFSNAKNNWVFEEESYLNSPAFFAEILDLAKLEGIRVFEQDDRLFCYPSIIRKAVIDRAVLIDKKKEKRIRPSVLVAQLKNNQNRPIRFKIEAFLECLCSAYSRIAEPGKVVKLIDIYQLLTLLPGQTKEYSKPEFGRDIYLLDKSGVKRTNAGLQVSFPASTGTRQSTNVISVITQEGAEKIYFGIKFDRA